MTDRNILDAALRADFSAFSDKVFSTLNPGATYQRNWHLDAIAHKLAQVERGEETRLIVTVPPRSRKSELASVALPAFIIGRDPAARVICVSYAQPLAAKHSRAFRKVLASDWYRRIFPGVVVDKDTEEIVETSVGGGRVATSVGGTVTGLGARTIIIDDPIKPDEAASEVARERAIEFHRGTLFSRLDGDKATGRIVLVMQRLHEDDLAGHLLRDGGWTQLCMPAIATEDATYDLGDGRTHHRKVGELLHPARESQHSLDQIRRNLGSATFEAQYQQSPAPADGLLVKRQWLGRYATRPDRSRLFVTQSWDTAIKGDSGANWSVCTTWGLLDDQHYLLDVYRERVIMPDLINAVVRQHRAFAADALLIEDKGSGSGLIQMLKRQHDNIYPIGITPTLDKATRLNLVTPMIEAGSVVLPKEADWLAAYEHELLGFPNVQHDDQVDSTSQYLTWARERGSGTFTVHRLFDDEDPTMGDVAHILTMRNLRGLV